MSEMDFNKQMAQLDKEIQILSEKLTKAHAQIDAHRDTSIKIMEALKEVLRLVSQNPLIDKAPFLACLNNL